MVCARATMETDWVQIRLKGSLDPEDIKRLCSVMINPRRRDDVKRLTNRSLLGIAPLEKDNIEELWVEAVFSTAQARGPGYVDDIFQGSDTRFIPGWYAPHMLGTLP